MIRLGSLFVAPNKLDQSYNTDPDKDDDSETPSGLCS